MTYAEMAGRLGVPYCGGCPITERSHERGFLFLDVVHFGERRFTRRGAKRFLMLVAERNRLLEHSGFLNTRALAWWHAYYDSVEAQRLAGQLGFRIPSNLFDPERQRCLWLAKKADAKLSPKVRKWARS